MLLLWNNLILFLPFSLCISKLLFMCWRLRALFQFTSAMRHLISLAALYHNCCTWKELKCFSVHHKGEGFFFFPFYYPPLTAILRPSCIFVCTSVSRSRPRAGRQCGPVLHAASIQPAGCSWRRSQPQVLRNIWWGRRSRWTHSHELKVGLLPRQAAFDTVCF